METGITHHCRELKKSIKFLITYTGRTTYDRNEVYTLRRKCFAYVHGHSAGGTNPSLVEILHFGKVVICFDCPYNRASTFEEGIYFKSVEELKDIVESEVQVADFNGDDLYEKVLLEYNWQRIANGYFKYI